MLGLAQSTVVSLSNVIGGQFPRLPNSGSIYALLEGAATPGAATPNPGQGLNAGFVAMDTDKKPIVKIRHYQPDTAATATVPSCDATTQAYVENPFKITMFRQTGLLVDWEYMQGLAKEASQVYNSGLMPDGSRFALSNTPIMEDIRQQLMAKMYKLVKDVNTDVLTKLATKFGINRVTGVNTAKSVTLLDANDNKLENGYNQIVTDFLFNDLNGTPVVIGGRRMQEFSNLMKWSSLASSGIDARRMISENPLAFYLDQSADTILGANNIAVIAPGAAQLVTWNRYRGPFTGEWGNGDFGSFTLPEFGPNLRFDIQVEKVSCPDPTAKFIVRLWFDVYTPDNIYAAGDTLAGVNGVLRYNVKKTGEA